MFKLILGALNVLGLAKRINAKVLQASTSEVYGDPEIHPQNENYNGNVNINGMRACYDEGKRCAETLFTEYHRMNKVNIRIIRIFNTYGPRMQFNDGRVISNFIVQALKNKDITVYGNGSQTRSFCYVDDLIEGMVKLMNKDDIHQPVNIGNKAEYKIKDLAEIIIKATNSNSKLIYNDLPPDDPLQRKPDTKLASQKLDWEAKVELKFGLEKTINYFSKLIENE